MLMAINEMLQLELEKQGFELCTPNLTFCEPVTGVVSVETPLLCEMLKGGELVFVTGCAFREEKEFFSLIRKLKQKGCAGVLLVKELYLQEIPEEVRVYCNDAKLPFYEICSKNFSAEKMMQISHVIYQHRKTEVGLSAALYKAIREPEKTEDYLSIFSEFQYERETKFCIGVIEAFHYQPDTRKKVGMKEKAEEMKMFLKQEYPEAVMTEYQEQFVFFFPDCEDCIARDIIMDLYQLIRSRDIDEYIYLGVSEKGEDLCQIHKYYRQAEYVILLKKKSALRIPVIRFSSLTTYKLLFYIEDKQAMKSYYNQHLYPLLEYDHTHGSNYFEMLEALIFHDFNVAETAADLYLHRNSVNYKINKIESILKCSLNSIAERTCLLESYKIWSLLYKEEKIPDRRNRNPAVTLVTTATGEARDNIALYEEDCQK